jgi:hypothetical protein
MAELHLYLSVLVEVEYGFLLTDNELSDLLAVVEIHLETVGVDQLQVAIQVGYHIELEGRGEVLP